MLLNTETTNNNDSLIILPRLVNYFPQEHPDWNPETGIFRNLTASVVLLAKRYRTAIASTKDILAPPPYAATYDLPV
jgi:hypothetical protein